ncbi:MAG: T9SS type A sorting domain-containing protein [Ginsengibacter sp.]
MKRILYIITFIAGFQFSSTAQVKPETYFSATKIVKYYPNPASSYINFEFSANYNSSYTLTIYNFIGKKIEDVKVNEQKITILLTDYYRGLYIYQLRDKKGNILESGKFQVSK